MNHVIPILAYHKVDSRRELGITSISPQRFEKQISFLKQNGYCGLSPQFLFKLTSDIAKPILITFDDGYEGIYKYVYPILKRYDFSAIVFLTTGYIGGYNRWDPSPGPRFKHLNWQQIKEMSNDGIWFGSHSVNHLFLTKQNDKTAKYEIEASKKNLEDELGKPIYYFSYPYGDYNDRIINFVKEIGYDAAFSLRPVLINNSDKDRENQRYKLPRFAIYCVDDMYAFRTKIGDAGGDALLYMQQLKNRLINRCSYAGMVVEKLRLLNKRT
jgi:peptidoglycan/xylan/chitin deacetylase (PgdA/CDA1 family)